MQVHDPKTETEWIAESVTRLRAKQKILEKRYPFELKWTYWDADEFRFQMRDEKTEVIEITRPDGMNILVTARLDWNHPEKLTLRPDHLIELFCTSPDQMKVILMTYKELGTFKLGLLVAPGLEEMQNFCKQMDKEIVDIAQDLRKQKISKGFDKIWMLIDGQTDLVTKRIQYYRTIVYKYSIDRDAWVDEMRRLGLLR